MTTPRGLGSLLAPVAVAALLWTGSVAAQDGQGFLDAYKEGVAAVEAEDWPRAEQLMRTAIAGRAEAADRLIRHLHLRPYVPHYYLGLSLAEQGRCEQALEAFAESERQGVVTGLAAEADVLRDRQGRCRQSVAAEAEARQERETVAELVERALQSAEAVAEIGTDPALASGWERGSPSLADRLAEAQATIDRAREQMREDDGEAADLAAAADLARGALGQLAAIRRETELRRQAVAEERESVAARVADRARSGRNLLAQTRELAARYPGLARSRNALAEVVERASGSEPDLPLAELQELARLLELRAADLRAAAAPPPEELLAAAAAWLRGEPRAVLELLAGHEDTEHGIGFRDPRAVAHALLLRAAAAFALHRSDAAPDGALLEAARRDAAACRRLDADLSPLPSAFSPGFRAFFDAAAPDPEPADEGP